MYPSIIPPPPSIRLQMLYVIGRSNSSKGTSNDTNSKVEVTTILWNYICNCWQLCDRSLCVYQQSNRVPWSGCSSSQTSISTWGSVLSWALFESWLHIMTRKPPPNVSDGFWDQYCRVLPCLILGALHISLGIHTEEELTHFSFHPPVDVCPLSNIQDGELSD